MLLLLALMAAAPVALAGNLHDPTRPDYLAGGSAAASSPGWELSSTLISPQRRVAIVNGETVAVGDRVNGAKVVTIRPGAVTLRTAEGVVTVELISATIKTAHSALQNRH